MSRPASYRLYTIADSKVLEGITISDGIITSHRTYVPVLQVGREYPQTQGLAIPIVLSENQLLIWQKYRKITIGSGYAGKTSANSCQVFSTDQPNSDDFALVYSHHQPSHCQVIHSGDIVNPDFRIDDGTFRFSPFPGNKLASLICNSHRQAPFQQNEQLLFQIPRGRAFHISYQPDPNDPILHSYYYFSGLILDKASWIERTTEDLF